MTLPSALFALLLASALGLLFHFVRGGGASKIALFVPASWLAFFAGHFVGEWMDWRLLRVGPLNLFPAILATAFGLILASILSGPEARDRPKRKGAGERRNELRER